MQPLARDIFTLDAQYYQDLFVVRVNCIIGYVLLLCEFFATINAEVKYIWPTRWSAVKMIYVANRYGNLAILAIANAQILGIWYEYTPSFCFRATLVLSLFQFASFAGVHVLVLLRAWVTWGKQPKVFFGLGALFIVYAAICIAIILWGLISGGAGAFPLSDTTRTCISLVPPLSWLIWAPSLVLEGAVFTLTMWSLREFSRDPILARRSRIIPVLFRDGMLYFALSIFTSVLNMYVWATFGDRPLNMLANTLTNALIIIAGQRLILDLRAVSGGRGPLTTTRVGREVDRAFADLHLFPTPSRSGDGVVDIGGALRTPSPIRFADGDPDEPASRPRRGRGRELGHRYFDPGALEPLEADEHEDLDSASDEEADSVLDDVGDDRRDGDMEMTTLRTRIGPHLSDTFAMRERPPPSRPPDPPSPRAVV